MPLRCLRVHISSLKCSLRRQICPALAQFCAIVIVASITPRARMSRHDVHVATVMTDVPLPLVGERSRNEIVSNWGGDVATPLVSIICHTFNHAGYIDDAIQGFLAQRTNFPFEVIVRDDASTDGTSARVAAYARRYPGLIRAVIERENRYAQGVTPTTVTFPMARGRFIAMCEGDDYWCDASKLQRQVECLRRNPQAGMAIHPAILVQYDIPGRALARRFCWHGDTETTIQASGIFAQISQFAPTSSYLFHANCLPDWIDFITANHPTFADFFLECIASRGTLAYQQEAMSVYRRDHAGSYSARECQLDGPALLARFHRNADATRALAGRPWVDEGDIRHRLALLRLDYLRKLARAGAYAELGALAQDGPVAVQQPRDWLHLHLSRRIPKFAKLVRRGRRALQRPLPPPIG